MGNPMRGASNATDLPAEPKLLWKVRVAEPPAGAAAAALALTSNYNGPITAAAVAGGRAYVAVPESHRVVALDAATGRQAWSFTAGGRVDTPPTIYDGLALFGCRDGWVYAVDAGTGSLAWRFLAAPSERYMVAFDGVESTWPLPGSVMVKDGVAVVAAGYHPETNGGIVAYGLDPHTGRMFWKTPVAHDRKPGPLGGKVPDDGITTRAYGYNANTVVNDLLTTDGTWVAMKGLCFDPRTGKIGKTVVAGKNAAGRAAMNRVSPLTTTLSFGMPPRTATRSWKTTAAPAGRGAWSLRVAGDDPKKPKVDVGGEMIAFNAERVACNRVGDLELGVWDRTSGKPSVAHYNSHVTADVSPPKELMQNLRTASPKALILAGDKVLLAVNRPAAGGQPRHGVVYLYAAKDAAPLDKLALDAPVIQTGLAASNGHLYVSLEDGTLACYGR